MPNGWRAYEDVPAEYVSTDTSLERDHFNFTLPTDRAIEFAVYYVDHRYTG